MTNTDIFYSELNTPLGIITITANKMGVLRIDFGDYDSNQIVINNWLKKWLDTNNIQQNDELLFASRQQLTEYFLGKRKEFNLPLLLFGTPFQKLVWQTLTNIPYGETRSYKEIALEINSPKSVRAIGGANHQNPIPIIIPCHRVIGSNGELVGYGGGIEIKKYLLEFEKNMINN